MLLLVIDAGCYCVLLFADVRWCVVLIDVCMCVPCGVVCLLCAVCVGVGDVDVAGVVVDGVVVVAVAVDGEFAF